MTRSFFLSGQPVTLLLAVISVISVTACGSDAAKVASSDTTEGTLVATQDLASTNIVCIDTAPAGDGWGWNGSEPCRITGDDSPTVLPQGADAVCIDTPPLDDGWGWNGWAACRLAGDEITDSDLPPAGITVATADTSAVPITIEQDVAFNPGDITDLILVTGQSNALGADAGFNSSLDAPNDRVFAFTDQGWRVADLDHVWDLGRYPRNAVNNVPSNNFGLHFGKRMAERLSNRVVGIVLVTAPGEAISHWNANGEFFAQTRDKVSRAVNELPHKSKVDGILWHQGESDGQDRDEYGEALFDLPGLSSGILLYVVRLLHYLSINSCKDSIRTMTRGRHVLKQRVCRRWEMTRILPLSHCA